MRELEASRNSVANWPGSPAHLDDLSLGLHDYDKVSKAMSPPKRKRHRLTQISNDSFEKSNPGARREDESRKPAM